MAAQECLFFMHKDGIVNDLNLLTISEIYNEDYDYTIKWLNDLDLIKDEDDYEVYANKLLTRFKLKNQIKFHDGIKFSNDVQMNFLIKNMIVGWNNCVHYSNNVIKSKSDKDLWKLWDSLVWYKKGNLNAIDLSENQLKLLTNVVKHRKEDVVFNFHNAQLKEENIILEIEKIENELKIVLMKNKVDADINENISINQSIKNKIKKIFKI